MSLALSMVAVLSPQGLANPCVPKHGSSWLSVLWPQLTCEMLLVFCVYALKTLPLLLTMVLGQDGALGELPSLVEQLLVQMGTSCVEHCCQLAVGNPVVWHQCPYSQLQR